MSKFFERAFETIIKVAQAPERRDAIVLRRKYIAMISQGPLVKVAFDTRRVNTETDFIPRRNLQNYHRSEAFIDKDASVKIKNFFKLKTSVDSIKDDFLGDPDWHDSYCRILSGALDRTLRVDQKDMDFFKPQLDYLEELLYLRYRLRPEDIQRLNERELRNLIIDRDERLLHKTIYSNYNLGGMSKNSNQSPQMLIKGPDPLIEKLFGDVKANQENKEVERSVTITIKDKIVDEKSDLTKAG